MRRLNFPWCRLRDYKLIQTLFFCSLFLLFMVIWSETGTDDNRRTRAEMADLANQVNSVRREIALKYIDNLDSSESLNFYEENMERRELELVVSIPTVGRSKGVELGYLIQTVAMFDKLLKDDVYFDGKMMFLCNTDLKPDQHFEMGNLQYYFPFVELYGNLSKIMPPIKSYYKSNLYHKNKYSKEAFDYMFCLDTALAYRSKYILMVQDDALPRKELLPVLHQLINRKHADFNSDQQARKKPFFLLKLFYPEKWLGFAFETERIMELVGIGALAGGIAGLLLSFFSKKSNRETIIMSALIGICFLLLALLIGRENLMELRRLSSNLYFIRSSPDCCIPAVLYRTANVSGLLRFLWSGHYSSSRPIDLAISQYSHYLQQGSYYVEPNLFHHTGMYSSLGKDPKNPEFYLFIK